MAYLSGKIFRARPNAARPLACLLTLWLALPLAAQPALAVRPVAQHLRQERLQFVQAQGLGQIAVGAQLGGLLDALRHRIG